MVRVPDRDHLRPTPRPPWTTPPGLLDPVPNTVVLSSPAAPAPLPVGVPIKVADACDVDGEGPWPTARVAAGGAMPGPCDTAAIDEAWTCMLAVGDAGGYLAPDAAPNVLKSLAAIDRPLAAEYSRRILRVNEVAVLLPEPIADVTDMFCIDGAAGFAWLVAPQRQLPTLRDSTWGDVSVGLEFWVGREPLLTSVPVPGDDWANELDARMMGRLAPVARAGHGAMRLPLRESADRTFLLPSAPFDCDFVFAAPRLLPWFLPRVFTHHAHRLATATRDPFVGEARLAAACAMVSAVLAAYERDHRLVRPPPLTTWALTLFGPVAFAQGDTRRATTLPFILAAWPRVPWGLVCQRLPYPTPGKAPPTVPYAHLGTMMSAERHWVCVAHCASSPTGLGCTEAALEAEVPPQFPYVDIGGDDYDAPHLAASAEPRGASGAGPPRSPRLEPQEGSADAPSDANGAASLGGGAGLAGGRGGADQGGGRRYPTTGAAAAGWEPPAHAGDRWGRDYPVSGGTAWSGSHGDGTSGPRHGEGWQPGGVDGGGEYGYGYCGGGGRGGEYGGGDGYGGGEYRSGGDNGGEYR